MRRLVLFIVLAASALAVVASSALAAAIVPSYGALSIKCGYGVIELKVFRGAMIGRVGKGSVTVTNPAENDCSEVLVWGAEDELAQTTFKDRRSTALALRCVYSGKNLRFRLVGVSNDVRIAGTNIALSAVGTGFVFLRGNGGDDGTIAVNADESASLPDERSGLFLTVSSVTPR